MFFSTALLKLRKKCSGLTKDFTVLLYSVF